MRDGGVELIIAGLLCLLFMVVGCQTGGNVERLRIQTEAVEQGHAEWVVSPNGSTKFRWLGGEDKPDD